MKRIISIVAATAIMCSILTGSIYAGTDLHARFKDIKDSDWFAEAVGKMNALRIIDGMPGGSFNPQGEVTRAQFVKMLVQAMDYQKIDSISFEDIKPLPARKAHWASVYIETALRNGVIVKDEIGNNFYPDVPVRRADMMIMLYRALKLTPSTGENPFADLTEANSCFTRLYEEYLVRGTIEGGKRLFKSEELTTRAEAAVIVARMVEYKENPQAFVAKSAMEERFKNGTPTTEDIALKRQIEIAKAKADPNYIIEPEIRILNTFKDFEGWGDRAERSFNLNAGYIAIDNLGDLKAYIPGTQIKIVCTDKDKDLINTVTLLTQPFISYDHVYEVRRDIWYPLVQKGYFGYSNELKTYDIKTIKRDEEKAVNGKWTEVPDYVKKGATLNFKLYLKRGNNTQEYDIKFKVN